MKPYQKANVIAAAVASVIALIPVGAQAQDPVTTPLKMQT